MRHIFLILAALCIGIELSACSPSTDRAGKNTNPAGLYADLGQPTIAESLAKPMPAEKAQAMLGTVSENWLYGEGVGNTVITAGTCVIFPPYLLWIVGNAALTLSGYEPITVAKVLPKEEGDLWEETYGSIASGPGRFAAALAGKEFRSQELAKEEVKKYLPDEPKRGKS